MPVIAPIDTSKRHTAKELWTQGFTFKAIANQTKIKEDTIRQWHHREGWAKPMPAVLTDAQLLATTDIASRLSHLTTLQAERILVTIRDTKLDGLKDCRDAATALSSAYSIARKALGLDDDRVQRVLHVHTMRQARGSSVTLDTEAVVVPVEQPVSAPQEPVADSPAT